MHSGEDSADDIEQQETGPDTEATQDDSDTIRTADSEVVPKVSNQRKKKKNTDTMTGRTEELKSLSAAATTASQVLTKLVEKKKTVESPNEDKDWDYCKFLYHKLKAIPDGDVKDELELEIQALICRAKKQITARTQATMPQMTQMTQWYPHGPSASHHVAPSTTSTYPDTYPQPGSFQAAMPSDMTQPMTCPDHSSQSFTNL